MPDWTCGIWSRALETLKPDELSYYERKAAKLMLRPGGVTNAELNRVYRYTSGGWGEWRERIALKLGLRGYIGKDHGVDRHFIAEDVPNRPKNVHSLRLGDAKRYKRLREEIERGQYAEQLAARDQELL